MFIIDTPKKRAIMNSSWLIRDEIQKYQIFSVFNGAMQAICFIVTSFQ